MTAGTPSVVTGPKRTVVYGAFKGMGDLICAVPAITWELNQGSYVVLLVFPQLPRELFDLLDFGPHRAALRVIPLPTPARLRNTRAFFAEMARLSPQFVWLSPHSPAPAASWRIPLLLSVVKRLYWNRAVLGGADTEPLSRFFDVRLPVDRTLPFAEREWLGYSRFRGSGSAAPPPVTFRESIQKARAEPPASDLVIHPGAGARNRRWPQDNYVKLVDLIPTRYHITIVGLAAEVAALKAVLPKDRSLYFFCGTLEEAVLAMSRSRVALTMDSGAMFFSRALGIPAVSLFGASDPRNVIGYESSVSPLYKHGCPCQPCESAECVQKSVLCMEALPPEMVAAALLELLSRGGETVSVRDATRAGPA
jgi:lipopolysaccharide heptosyltransferase II